MKKIQVYLYLIMANIFWAGNYIFGKLVVSELTPVQMTFSRWFIALFLLFPLAQWLEKPDWKAVLRHWPILLLSSLLGIVGYNYFLYEALQFTTSLNASLVNAMNPTLIVFCAAIFLKEKLTWPTILGLFTSLFGVLFVLTKGDFSILLHKSFNLGDLIMLGAIVVWTAYSLLGRKLKHIPPISATAVSAALGVLFLLPFFLASGNPFPISGQAITGIIYIGIFPSVASFICWNKGIRAIGASRSGVYMSLITLFTAIFSVLLGNPLEISQVIGGLFVFAGVCITIFLQKKASATVDDTEKN